MIRFLETFQGNSTSGNLNGGAIPPSSLKYVDSPDLQHAGWNIGAGRYPGTMAGYRSLNIIQSYSSLKILDTQPHWYFSGPFTPSDSFGLTDVLGDFIWLIFGTALGPPTLTVVLDGFGFMRFYTGGNGTNANRGSLIATSNTQFAYGTWRDLDIVMDVPSRRLEFWVDDVQDLLVSNVVWSLRTPTAYPDRFTLCLLQNLGNRGYGLDAFGIGDGQGSVNNTRLGPVRGAFVRMRSDAAMPQWTRSSAAAGNYAMVDDLNLPLTGWPDGDATYVYPQAPGNVDLYGVAAPPCIGRVLGLALNCCLKSPTQPAPVDLVVRPDPTSLAIDQVGGSVGPPLSGLYATQQTITERSILRPGAPWTDGEIGNAYWGIRSVGGTPRVTSFYIEKLLSTRVQPYDCGGLGSYSF